MTSLLHFLGMRPNVLEVPFDLDLGPEVQLNNSSQEHEQLHAGRDKSDIDAGTSGFITQDDLPCWLRAYIPIVPFLQPPSLEDLSSRGWQQGAAEVGGWWDQGVLVWDISGAI